MYGRKGKSRKNSPPCITELKTVRQAGARSLQGVMTKETMKHVKEEVRETGLAYSLSRRPFSMKIKKGGGGPSGT